VAIRRGAASTPPEYFCKEEGRSGGEDEGMSLLRATYLLLTGIGVILPMASYLPWLQETGGGAFSLIATWQQNGASAGLFRDMLVSALTLNLWILAETYVRRDYWVLITLPVIYLIGVSAALPLFLFLRSRPMG